MTKGRKINIQKPLVSCGENHGNIKAVITGNTIINNSNSSSMIVIIAIISAFAIVFMAALCYVIISANKVSAPHNVTLKVGKRGGVYWVDSNGGRHYVDRKAGLKIIEKRNKENGNP